MKQKLFILLLGGKPYESTIEQHNVYFGVGKTLKELFPAVKRFWPSAPKIHVDAYMAVEQVENYKVTLVRKEEVSEIKLFFINLGGYRHGCFEEIHKKLLIPAKDEEEAVKLAKEDRFFRDGVQEGKAMPHIDDKHMLDEFEDERPIDIGEETKKQGFALLLEKVDTCKNPIPEITGYLRIP